MSATPTFVLRAGPFDLTGKTVIPGTNSCTIEAGSDGFEFGQVTAEQQSRATSLRDGQVTYDGPFGNRVAEFPVRFKAANSSDLYRGIAAVWRWCAKPDTYTWQHPDGLGVATTFQALRAWLTGQSTPAALSRITEILTLSVECLPFGRSPQQRTTPTYKADGTVRQVPVVGAARTPASIEIGGIGNKFDNVLVMAHPSLASGFQPLLLRAAGATTTTFNVPTATLPPGGFMLLGPRLVDSGSGGSNPVVRVNASVSTYKGAVGSGTLVAGSTVTSRRAPSYFSDNDQFQTHAVVNLPSVDIAGTGYVEITLTYTKADNSTSGTPPFGGVAFCLVPLDDDCSLTTLTQFRDGTTRVFLDAASFEQPRDRILEGTQADRSDAVGALSVTRWAVPQLRPNGLDGTTSMLAIVTFLGGGVSSTGTWKATYWPMWPGMAPE